MRTLWLEPNAQEYTFGGLGSGQYRICVNGTTSAAQRWFECYDNVSSLARGTTITFTTEAVSQGQIRANIDFRLGDGADRGSIQGRVRNVDGEPLAEITTVLIPVPIVTPITSSLLAPSGTAGPSHRKGQNATPLSWAAPASKTRRDGAPRWHPVLSYDTNG
ncbi:MAG: hypothetical protein R2932_05425 [Caldilineaceae bacterium]